MEKIIALTNNDELGVIDNQKYYVKYKDFITITESIDFIVTKSK